MLGWDSTRKEDTVQLRLWKWHRKPNGLCVHVHRGEKKRCTNQWLNFLALIARLCNNHCCFIMQNALFIYFKHSR